MLLNLLDTSIQPSSSVEFTSTVVIVGFGSVIAALILLIIIFNIFGKIMTFASSLKEKRKKENDSPAPQGVPAPPVIKSGEVPPPPQIEEGIAPEVIAAISAAICAYEGEGVKITSLRRRQPKSTAYNPWAFAAQSANTRPFQEER